MTPKALSREIKFRAWWPNNGEGTMETWEQIVKEDNFVLYFLGQYPVLMQFTNILDKNGKEIYEGDILAYSNENSPRHGAVKGYIVYDNGAFRLKRKNEEQSHLDTITVPSYQRTHEVVGNIYEHPHLLTKENK